MIRNEFRTRCQKEYLEEQLKKKFHGENIFVDYVGINETGEHKAKGDSFNKIFGVSKNIQGLPPFCEVHVTWHTGQFKENIIVWSPVEWNDRFAGTAGGGVETGGAGFLTAPDDYTRGWTVPYAVMEGFTAATASAENVNGLKDYILDPESGKIRRELYENWRARTTHHMTLIGKAVAELLHDRPVKYSYMSGGSGGGRQCLMEAQEYPQDYDGIWASCPAINWNRFLLEGIWFIALMNSAGHILAPAKIQYMTERVWKEAGGKEAYFSREEKAVFDACSLVGEQTKKGKITTEDAKLMQAIWNGPADAQGNRLWYGFRPGVKFWNVGIPVGAFYYSLFRKQPKPFFLSTMFARWVTENPKQSFDKITLPEFESLFRASVTKLADAGGSKADLSAFAAIGGKLMIDHGLNDPLIPVDGTVDYYKRMISCMGQEEVDAFCRLYLVPGDGHGNCWNEQPGIPQSSGIEALMNWVEHGQRPEGLPGVRANKKNKEIIKKAVIKPVDDIRHWE